MKRLTEQEQDVLAMAVMGFIGELPEEMAGDLTPIGLSIIAKLELKPAVARATAVMQQTALTLTEKNGSEQ